MNLHSFLSGNTILVSKTFVERVGRHEAFQFKTLHMQNPLFKAKKMILSFNG